MTLSTSVANLVAASNAVTLAQLGTDGQTVLSDAVKMAQSLTGLTGAEKFSVALSKAGNDLLALGKDVGLYALHLGIEAAYQELQGALTPEQSVATPVVQTPEIASNVSTANVTGTANVQGS